MLKGIIFDLDGVLINSERKSVEDNRDFLWENGVEPNMGELIALVGTTDLDNFAYMAKILKVDFATAQAMLERYIDEHPMHGPEILMPGAISLLEFLKNRELVIALASNSPLDFVDRMLDECGMRPFFDHIVSGRTLNRCKPDPAIYLYSMKQLGLFPEELLVMEDSPYGVEAAVRAGLRVAALRDPVLELDLSQATWQIDSLDQMKDIVKQEMIL